MRMSRFMDAPTEVILLVASHLTTADKASLLRVSKALHQIVESSLYHDISMDWRKYPDPMDWTNIPVPTPPLELLLGRVIACPRLANFVRHVQFTGFRDGPLWESPARSKPCDDDMRHLIDLVKPSGLTTSYNTLAHYAKARSYDEQSPWVRHIKEGEVDLYQALFISRLPNITYLQIGFDSQKGYQYISGTLHHAVCSSDESSVPSSFRWLQRVDLYANMFYRNLTDLFAQTETFDNFVSDVLPFFYLPSLREFRVAMPNEMPNDDVNVSWPTAPPCAVALKILRLQRSHIKVALLEQLLVVVPNLEILEYDFCCEVGRDRWIPINHYFRGDALGRALAPLRYKLKTLRVSVHFYFGPEAYYEDPTPNYGIEGVLESLKGFRNLVELEVPFALILGTHAQSNSCVSVELPPNLRFLILRDDMALFHLYPWRSAECLKAMSTYLLLWPMCGSQTRSLGLNLNESPDDWDEKALSAFQTLCRSMHIVPKIHKQAWDCTWPGTPIFATDRFD